MVTRTWCSRIKEKYVFSCKKNDLTVLDLFNALNRSHNRDCSLVAHLLMSYHLI